MKKLFLTVLFVFISFFLFAQSSSKVEIKGILQDTSAMLLPSTSVLLLLPQDSTLVAYTLTDTKGQFSFKNVKRQPYLLKATFVSYLPYQEPISLSDGSITDVGIIELKPIIKELYEVVVKTAKAPISIKGDTVEYDASKFKVPPGSTVEDLLRKLPGIEVTQDGSIIAQGEQVRKVTVDGKRFFGDDPKMATKNLGADAINKVQVFNDKSEQSKLTGVEDGQREKTVNLELKEEARKGGFGKATAGYGTSNRTSVSANYNKFDSKNQLAIIGFGNNINQTGMSWDDYQDFRGSNSFNWDDADFGFSSDGAFRYFSFNDEAESFNLPISDDRGNGYTTNYAGGINYNYDHKKNQFSANYFYNHSKLQLDSYNRTQRFLENNQSYLQEGVSNQFDLRGNHKITLRGQKQLDSLNIITLVGNGRISNQSQLFSDVTNAYNQTILTNSSQQNNTLDRLSYAGAISAIYTKKFKKEKGRSFALSGTSNSSFYDNEGIQKSINEFFQITDINESLKKINQLNEISGISNQFKSSVLYVEPFAKKLFWESFYNISYQNNTVDRAIFDKIQDSDNGILNNALSRFYNNTILYNRLGTSLRYSYKGINITGGLAAVRYNLDGIIEDSQGTIIAGGIENKVFQALTPYSEATFSMKNNRFFNINYSTGIRPPSISDLQPIVDNRNPLYLKEGNPDLLPEKQQSVRLHFSQYNPASFVSLFSSVYYTYNTNQIVYNQRINPTTLVTYSKPMNISGGQNGGGYFGFGFPLKKTKATLNLNSNIDIRTYLSYVNDVLNTTNTNNYNLGLRLGLTPNDWFSLYANANWGIGNTKYSINTSQNQKILTNEYRGEMTVQFPKKIYWITNLNYRIYKNERMGFNQQLPILNMSVHKQFGKKNQWEARLAAYDIFKRNLGITQNAFQNFVTYSEIKTLSRYFMLKLTYNMRGNSTQLRKDWF